MSIRPLPDETWWETVERAEQPAQANPPWLSALEEAHHAELRFRLEAASQALSRALLDLPREWRAVHELLRLRIAARTATAGSTSAALSDTERLLATELTPALRGRCLHLYGTLLLRLNRLDEAEAALASAIGLLGSGRARAWALDSFATVLTGQGAVEEARRLLRHLVEQKANDGDTLGAAISLGNLARLELRGGTASVAGELVQGALSRWQSALEPLALLRLETAWVEATLAGATNQAAAEAQRALEHRLHGLGGEQHYLIGFGHLALARAWDGERRRLALTEAERQLSLPAHRALWAVWRESLLGDADDVDGWLAALAPVFEDAGPNTEAELRAQLLVGSRARARGNAARAAQALDEAARGARGANNALWMGWVDEEWQKLDAAVAQERVLMRFSGVPPAQLNATRREAVTVLFADLVGFTSRSSELSPEEVMSTVRSLFEGLAVVLVKHRVRPLAYLGDGLLAICEGEAHEQRGANCALDLLRRAARLSVARRAAGERWGLDLRAGVASGFVVLGPLGNQIKLDFTAIGMPVNLAARLQGAAEPGQVLIEEKTAIAAGLEHPEREELTLKGVAGSTRAVRVTPV
jgi:class 3 adenylate cyclase/tetratricopeptide (TPR) repeat protein